jgi:hypothetical protein
MGDSIQEDNLLTTADQVQIVAKLPKEAFKAMFYLFAGKPDSKVKLFHKPVLVTHEDLREITRKIEEKFSLHLINRTVNSVAIKFRKNETTEFGTWDAYEAYDRQIPQVTEEITLRWDFLLELPMFMTPQRHTLTVRLSNTPRPRDIIQLLVSQDPDDDLDISNKLALCVARVDFISHRLADELIDVVAEWNEALPKPAVRDTWFNGVEKRASWFPRVIQITLPLFYAVTALSILGPALGSSVSDQVTVTSIKYASGWILLSIISLQLIQKFAHYLASQTYRSIQDYGSFTPFLITKGDRNRSDELARNNHRTILRFFGHSLAALILNVIAAGIAWYFFPK